MNQLRCLIQFNYSQKGSVMGIIMIMGFIVAMVSAVLFLLSYIFEPVLTTSLVLNLSIYSAFLSIQSLVAFIPLYLLNNLFREMEFHHKMERNIIDDLAKGVTVLILVFTGFTVYNFGLYEEELYPKLMEYLTSLV